MGPVESVQYSPTPHSLTCARTPLSYKAYVVSQNIPPKTHFFCKLFSKETKYQSRNDGRETIFVLYSSFKYSSVKEPNGAKIGNVDYFISIIKISIVKFKLKIKDNTGASFALLVIHQIINLWNRALKHCHSVASQAKHVP